MSSDPGKKIRTSRYRLSAKRSTEETPRLYLLQNKTKQSQGKDNEELYIRHGTDPVSPLSLPLMRKHQKHEKEKAGKIVWYPQSSPRVITLNFGAACPHDANRRKESCGDFSAQMRQVMPSAEGKEPREVPIWESTGNDTGSTGVAEISGMSVCQFEVCEKEATFDVNGVVRYW